ncbi:RNA exonuclease 3 [Lunasporangiospora selenospora]|uniref:RNA exonuclease 3 n=1 Tax=Lunasporangiospora selenospora TaxID=979761 RepID=A0A9P6KGR1_9FUNG|nr:RNA exonuclease 3 [Lunasporangiospora selenospora]
MTPLAAMVAAKQRKEALESKMTAPPTLKPQARGNVPVPVILNRSLRTGATASSASTSKVGSSSKLSAASTLKATGPPVLRIDLRAHSKPQFRQSVATQYYNEFYRMYAPLGELGSKLATAHAVDQEKSVHSKTNQGSYRGIASTTLLRLKKRPVAVDDDDVGIDGEWTDPAIRIEEAKKSAEVWEAIDDYVSSTEALERNGYPVEIPSTVASSPLDPILECDRCHQKFEVPGESESWVLTACKYHDRKLRNIMQGGEKIRVFICCESPVGSPGCREGPHVYKEDGLQLLHSRTRFIETPSKTLSGKEPHPVVAMDCEMGYTTGGFELIRISVVDENGKIIMDELVRPENTVLDLNTQFSGIASLDDAKYNLTEARDRLLELINKDTVIIGHSLENDFKVMRLVHTQVVDTAILFPHPQNYLEYRYSLRILAKQHLGLNIQESETGHDSFEDAKTCLDLVRHKIKKDKSIS